MYAIQVMFDGSWTYVMNYSGNVVQEYEQRETADKVAASWRKPGFEWAVRVVEYNK